MNRRRRGLFRTAMVVPASILLMPNTAQASQLAITRLVEVRAARHEPKGLPKYERVVFEFDRHLPFYKIEYVKQLIQDGSGLPVKAAGNAFLQVTFTPAYAHDDNGNAITRRRILFLANVRSVVQTGDFEAVVTYGIGMTRKSELRIQTLDTPSRLVIDLLEY